jgi:hypothetical protein
MPSIYDALPRSAPEAYALVVDPPYRALGTSDRVVRTLNPYGEYEVTLRWREPGSPPGYEWTDWAKFQQNGAIILFGPERLPLALMRRMNRVAPFGWRLRRPLGGNRRYNPLAAQLVFMDAYTLEWEGYARFDPNGDTAGWSGGSPIRHRDLMNYVDEQPRRYERPRPPRRRARQRPRPSRPTVTNPWTYTASMEDPVDAPPVMPDITDEMMRVAIERLRTRPPTPWFEAPAPGQPFTNSDGSPCGCDLCVLARERGDRLALEA